VQDPGPSLLTIRSAPDLRFQDICQGLLGGVQMPPALFVEKGKVLARHSVR
jgi:hypothetical protein